MSKFVIQERNEPSAQSGAGGSGGSCGSGGAGGPGGPGGAGGPGENELFKWFMADRKLDTLSFEDSKYLFDRFINLGYETISMLGNIGWDTIENSVIEKKFLPWLSTWLPRNYKNEHNDPTRTIEGVWEDSVQGRKCTIKNCVDSYLEKVDAPKNKDLLETWWEGCQACNHGCDDPHDETHPKCKLNNKSNDTIKQIFDRVKVMRTRNCKIFYVIEDGEIKNDGVITMLNNDNKVKLQAAWGKNGAMRTWCGEICDNQTKIKWTGRRGTSFWYKIS